MNNFYIGNRLVGDVSSIDIDTFGDLHRVENILKSK